MGDTKEYQTRIAFRVHEEAQEGRDARLIDAANITRRSLLHYIVSALTCSMDRPTLPTSTDNNRMSRALTSQFRDARLENLIRLDKYASPILQRKQLRLCRFSICRFNRLDEYANCARIARRLLYFVGKSVYSSSVQPCTRPYDPVRTSGKIYIATHRCLFDREKIFARRAKQTRLFPHFIESTRDLRIESRMKRFIHEFKPNGSFYELRADYYKYTHTCTCIYNYTQNKLSLLS